MRQRKEAKQGRAGTIFMAARRIRTACALAGILATLGVLLSAIAPVAVAAGDPPAAATSSVANKARPERPAPLERPALKARLAPPARPV